MIRLLGVMYGVVATWFAPAMVLAVLALLGLLLNPRVIGLRHLLVEVATVSFQFGCATLASVGLWRLRRWGLGVACAYNLVWAGVLSRHALESGGSLSSQDTMPLALVAAGRTSAAAGGQKCDILGVQERAAPCGPSAQAIDYPVEVQPHHDRISLRPVCGRPCVVCGPRLPLLLLRLQQLLALLEHCIDRL